MCVLVCVCVLAGMLLIIKKRSKGSKADGLGLDYMLTVFEEWVTRFSHCSISTTDNIPLPILKGRINHMARSGKNQHQLHSNRHRCFPRFRRPECQCIRYNSICQCIGYNFNCQITSQPTSHCRCVLAEGHHTAELNSECRFITPF